MSRTAYSFPMKMLNSRFQADEPKMADQTQDVTDRSARHMGDVQRTQHRKYHPQPVPFLFVTVRLHVLRYINTLHYVI